MRSLLLAGILFVLAYTQSPRGFSNQNQYLLHAESMRPDSYLSADWLANTRDPTPMFSWYVATTDFGVPSWSIFVSYAAILVLYVVSLALLIEKTVGLPATQSGRRFALALLLLAHAAVWRWLAVQAVGVDYPWYFQCGVAGQYILGAGFQPSVFGVLLVASLAAFVRERPILAVAFAVGGSAMHFTYLLPVTLLGLGYLVSTKVRFGWKPTLRLALAFVLGLAPVVAFNAFRFLPTDEATFAEAQRLLVEVRIPHHAVVQKWLDPIAMMQVAWIAIAIGLVHRSSLATVLAVSLVASALLSVLAAFANVHLLSLLFPWRISAVLVPVSTAIILGKFVLALERRSKISLELLAWPVIVASFAFGIVSIFWTIGYNMNEASERELLEHINRTKRRGEVYLIPTRIPNLSGGRRGNISTTFTPPPRPTSGNLIAVDLQRFRLAAGAPLYVDFKSIPYADVEILEWFRRVRLAEQWYKDANWREAIRELKREGITHVVIGANAAFHDPRFELVYSDSTFHVYRIESAPDRETAMSKP